MKKVVKMFLLSGIMLVGLSLSNVNGQVAEPKGAKKTEKMEEAKRLKAELGLSDEQVMKLKAIRKTHQEKTQAIKSASAGKSKKDIRAELKVVNESFQGEIKSLLTPDQYTKWSKMKEEKKAERKANRESGKM